MAVRRPENLPGLVVDLIRVELDLRPHVEEQREDPVVEPGVRQLHPLEEPHGPGTVGVDGGGRRVAALPLRPLGRIIADGLGFVLSRTAEKGVVGVETLDEIGMALEERVRPGHDGGDVDDLAPAEAREEVEELRGDVRIGREACFDLLQEG
uniref:Uncharacterized protein n=1 Tax=Triticum urartu TaxID=4572 RepID=A0A8R7VBR1_TRIUA